MPNEPKNKAGQASRQDEALVTDPLEVQMRLLQIQLDRSKAMVEGFDDPVDTKPAQAVDAATK